MAVQISITTLPAQSLHVYPLEYEGATEAMSFQRTPTSGIAGIGV